MNTASQLVLLSSIFRNVYCRSFRQDDLNDRVMMQKAVFMLREMGITCGSYDFVWDHFGPFSPDLSDDMKRHIKSDGKEFSFNSTIQDALIKLRDLFQHEGNYDVRHWCEAIASLLYIRRYISPIFNDEKVIVELETRKKTEFSDHDENLRAMKCLNEFSAYLV